MTAKNVFILTCLVEVESGLMYQPLYFKTLEVFSTYRKAKLYLNDIIAASGRYKRSHPSRGQVSVVRDVLSVYAGDRLYTYTITSHEIK